MSRTIWSWEKWLLGWTSDIAQSNSFIILFPLFWENSDTYRTIKFYWKAMHLHRMNAPKKTLKPSCGPLDLHHDLKQLPWLSVCEGFQKETKTYVNSSINRASWRFSCLRAEFFMETSVSHSMPQILTPIRNLKLERFSRQKQAKYPPWHHLDLSLGRKWY